ncbi:uncharacterized protein N7446_009287 [Penicillium canescens]|uniref:Uncharacterized protein n=1 Tax=Penicillium canescens TaxID=5083 RepID=A0AAD6N603_PENCN|nr:uncharacterized protein N7446_009287 [Penicillium canescens]KAJ6034538.1 hypothetical protein N7460_008713 [Penicillium canescens]KAJ6046197.1 hypothetical protein N7444_007451 [Penicillium canescens]KAJ6053275.1 hypothetical protein N7446_009287 [Penicillium canescens]
MANTGTRDWKRVLNINLDGTFYVLRAAAKIMLKQEPILSIKGSITAMPAAYDTSKHAIIGRTNTASEDYAKDGLRVNAICPGYTATPLTMDVQYL